MDNRTEQCWCGDRAIYLCDLTDAATQTAIERGGTLTCARHAQDGYAPLVTVSGPARADARDEIQAAIYADERANRGLDAGVFGFEFIGVDSRPRSVIAEPTVATAGNVIVRVGRENGAVRASGNGWHGTEHVVLTPDEARTLADQLSVAADAGETNARHYAARERSRGRI